MRAGEFAEPSRERFMERLERARYNPPLLRP